MEEKMKKTISFLFLMVALIAWTASGQTSTGGNQTTGAGQSTGIGQPAPGRANQSIWRLYHQWLPERNQPVRRDNESVFTESIRRHRQRFGYQYRPTRNYYQPGRPDPDFDPGRHESNVRNERTCRRLW